MFNSDVQDVQQNLNMFVNYQIHFNPNISRTVKHAGGNIIIWGCFCVEWCGASDGNKRKYGSNKI